MLSYNEITQKKYIDLDGTPYEVVSSHISRKQSQKPTNQTKLKNLITGKVIEKNFHSSETVLEAIVETEKYTYLFKKPSRRTSSVEYWFAKGGNPKDRVEIPAEIIKQEMKYVKERSDVDVLIFNEKIIGIKIPIKTTLRVAEAPPGVRGNTAQGGTKPVVLETGITVSAPLFINEGDSIVVNTQTGEYVSRA